MQDFRNLDVWHKAHALAIDVHKTLVRHKRSEVEYWILLARDVGYFPQSDFERLTSNAIEVRKMLFGLRRAVRNGSASKPSVPPEDPTPL